MIKNGTGTLGYFFKILLQSIDVTVYKNFGHFNFFFSIMVEVIRRRTKYTPTSL